MNILGKKTRPAKGKETGERDLRPRGAKRWKAAAQFFLSSF